MSEILMALMVWIGANTQYNTTLDLPNVVFTTQHNMCAQYGIRDKTRCDDARLRGFFDKKLTIYMSVNFDSADPHSRSQLLHELIHYVQWANGRGADTCLGHLELEAYVLQDRWRTQNDLRPTLGDFNRMMLSASCDA